MATGDGTYQNLPLVVLVNERSASASEIVAACLQDHDRAVTIGERTWGKGSVQNVIDIPGAASALKLTTASYHRPNGHNIHRFPGAKDTDEWGVMPDKEYNVRFSLSEMQEYLDYRRDRDVLSKTGPPKSEFVDKQLVKAISSLGKKDDPANAKKPAAKATKAVKAPVPKRRAAPKGTSAVPEFPLLVVPRSQAA
jgi:carboxyl-terminal processing protease